MYVKEKIKFDDLVKECTLATVEDIRKEMAIAKEKAKNASSDENEVERV